MNSDDLFPALPEPANSFEKILRIQTKKFLANSNFSQANFVHESLLPVLIKLGLEQPGQFTTAIEYEKWHSNKVRQINNVLNDTTNVPARWINVWLSALPAPYGTDARKQILNLMGALDLPDLSSLQIPVAQAYIGQLLREVADVMTTGASAAADGVYDAKDDPQELKQLSNELVDVIEASIGQLLAIHKVVNLTTTRAGLIVQSLKINNNQIK